jgi:hypothetical protein
MSNNENTYLPIVTCPECLDSTCYPIELAMACDKCGSTYPINIKYFNNKILINFDNFRLDEYLKELNTKKEKINSFNNALMSNVIANESSLNSFSVVFSGKTLELLKKIKADNNMPSLMLTIKLILEGFIYIIKELKNMPGQKVFLLDSNGNKSDDIKKNVLRAAYNVFHEEQDKEIVQSLLSEMDVKFTIEDVKKEAEDNNAPRNTDK